MRPALTTALAVAFGCSVVAGCGGSSPAATMSTAAPTAPATTAPAPIDRQARTALAAAFQRLQRAPYRAIAVTRQAFDAEAAPPELARALAAVPTTTTTTAAVESPRRIMSAASVPIGPTVARVRTVMHDGAWFISRDGRDWRRTSGSLGGALAQATSIGTGTNPVEQLVDLRDAGADTFAGASARRYSGSIDPQIVRHALGAIFVRLGVDPGFVTIRDARSAFFVRDGELVGQRTDQRVAVDLARLPGGLEGVLAVRVSTTVRFLERGRPVRVARPAASGSVSTPAELAAFLSG
jgi:hypothetical protein